MKELIGKLLEYRKRNTTILIILLVIVLVTLLFLNGTFKLPFTSQQETTNNQLTQELLDQAEKALKDGQLMEQQNAPANKIAVKIATLASDDYDGAVTGPKVGCDVLRMVYRYIDPTPAILNATMKELFAYDQQFDYMPGNFVASQEKLSFEKAVIENGVAKIYLNGEVEYAGVCDDPRLATQIIATAKQFETVQNVEIYLNGTLYEIPSQK